MSASRHVRERIRCCMEWFGGVRDAPSQVAWQAWSFHRDDQRSLVALISVAAVSLLATLGLQSRRSAGWIRADDATAVAYRPWLDLNACDWPELCLVPGISETLARRIVDARRELGAFRHLNDLQRVQGIGPKKLRQLAAAAGVAETMPSLYLSEATRLGTLE